MIYCAYMVLQMLYPNSYTLHILPYTFVLSDPADVFSNWIVGTTYIIQSQIINIDIIIIILANNQHRHHYYNTDQ